MIFQKIITNSTAWSFLISGFTGLLAFNGRNKIFSIINKSILSILTTTISGLLIKQGSETGKGLLNLAYIRDIVYKTIETSNPITTNTVTNSQIVQETIKQVINNKEVIETSSTGFNVLLESGIYNIGNFGLYCSLIGLALCYLSPSIFNNIKLIPEKFLDGFFANSNDPLFLKFVTATLNSMTALSLENYLVLMSVSLGFVCFFYLKRKLFTKNSGELDEEPSSIELE